MNEIQKFGSAWLEYNSLSFSFTKIKELNFTRRKFAHAADATNFTIQQKTRTQQIKSK